MGVPVIVAGDQVIVGFDRPRLERILASVASPSGARPSGPQLGLLVRDTAAGVEVGTVRPGLLAERAGVMAGDVLEDVAGQLIGSVSDLERVAQGLKPGESVAIAVRRQGQGIRLSTPVG